MADGVSVQGVPRVRDGSVMGVQFVISGLGSVKRTVAAGTVGTGVVRLVRSVG